MLFRERERGVSSVIANTLPNDPGPALLTLSSTLSYHLRTTSGGRTQKYFHFSCFGERVGYRPELYSVFFSWRTPMLRNCILYSLAGVPLCKGAVFCIL